MDALHYLRGRDDCEHDFFKYTIGTDGRLQHMFWVDENSKLDYKCFSDVKAFNTTYKKNKYNKPFLKIVNLKKKKIKLVKSYHESW